ncbi:MAG: ATP-binding protein [Candidatus Limnocylindria bacterium]
MELLRPTRRALTGALIGAAAAAADVWLAGGLTEDTAFVALLILAVALIGLGLGPGAAMYAYVAGAAVLLAGAAMMSDSAPLGDADVLRMGVFLVGSPLIVLLVYRAEMSRYAVEDARDAAEDARREAEEERRSHERARQEVEEARRLAEQDRARLEEVAEAIPEPLVVYDAQMQGTYGNRAALRLFGRRFVERPLDDWGRVVEPRDERGVPLDNDQWPQVRAQREAMRRRLILRIPMSGRDVMVDVEGTPIPGGGCVLLLRDVSKEEDARRRLSGFASFVAHELRNPLAVAKARIELAQRDPELPRRAAGHGGRALESVDAAIAILERLELYSRADSGRIEAARERFTLLPAVDASVERLRARGSDREVTVRVPPELAVVGDRQLAEQAITNLLTNADRYSHQGEPIRIEATDGDLVALRVIDAGPGIADNVADGLFRDRLTVGRGLGLGLYLVAATMQAVGGSVQLEQRRPAAVFALRWPRAPHTS